MIMKGKLVKMIHTVRPGDTLKLIAPDGTEGEPFVLAEPITIEGNEIWVWRENDMPLILDRIRGLDATFVLVSEPEPYEGRHRA